MSLVATLHDVGSSKEQGVFADVGPHNRNVVGFAPSLKGDGFNWHAYGAVSLSCELLLKALGSQYHLGIAEGILRFVGGKQGPR